MILLSLKSTSYCSEQSTEKDTIQAPRTLSHDGTRDGMFGSARDTFTKLGTPYYDKTYDLGSDDTAPGRWALFGNTITTLEDAQKLKNAVDKKGATVPAVWTLQAQKAVTQKSLEIIEADRQVQIKASHDKFTSIQKDGIGLVATIAQRLKDRQEIEKTNKQLFTNTVSDLHSRIEKAQHKYNLQIAANTKNRKQEDAAFAAELIVARCKSRIFKDMHNEAFSDNQIQEQSIFKNTKINDDNIPKIINDMMQRQEQKATQAKK